MEIERPRKIFWGPPPQTKFGWGGKKVFPGVKLFPPKEEPRPKKGRGVFLTFWVF